MMPSKSGRYSCSTNRKGVFVWTKCLVYLGGEVVLLQLPSLSQVPGPHSVIQASSPQLCPIIRDVYTAGSVGVALELPEEKHSQTNPHTVSM